MRSYSKKFSYKKTAGFQQRSTRTSREWDVRIDVNESINVQDIINNIKRHQDGILYVMVSGIERPDTTSIANQHGSNEHHVHIAIVLLSEYNRNDVLVMLRGQRKHSDEYCAPRNTKFTYAGWIVHHSKQSYKLDNEPAVRYEYGTLPLDAMTIECARAMKRIFDKFDAPDTIKSRFNHYLAMVKQESTQDKINKYMEKIECLRMEMNDKSTE